VKFLVDEDVPAEAALCLQQAGHQTFLVTETLDVRTDDVDVWQYAVESQSIVITCNRQDFLELAGTAPETGLIVLNRRRTRTAECQHLLALLKRAGETGLNGNINFA
jgi:predicted nuclease of predicted toxin-antitoxin system